MRRHLLALSLALATSLPATATPASTCSMCAEWNAAQAPFRIYGNTYYVGPKGLSSLLITSRQGHILVDGALPESAASIAANIKALGFKLEDIKLILNSHAHFDHAGGLAELQRLTGADVVASAAGAQALQAGAVPADDPQHGDSTPFAPVKKVRIAKDGETLHIGPLAVTMHATVGHTPGGSSWSWHACQDGQCKRFVYAESLTAVSSDGYKYTAHPAMLQGLETSFKTLENLPCDILVSTHPGFSNVLENLARREAGQAQAFIDPASCKRYVAQAREGLAKRIANEKQAPATAGQ